MKAVIVIPAYNEADAIALVVSGARRYAPVIVVDDGSTDDSAGEAARAGADVIRHARRRGKAAALRTGFAAARARGAAFVVTLDGDGQHEPDDVPALLGAVRETPDQLVVGNRLTATEGFARSRLNAMEVAAFFVEWVTALGVRDTQSGVRAYPVALLDVVGGCRKGFVFETEVLIAAARRGWNVREVAVSSVPAARRESRFRPVRDGVAIGVYLAGQALVRWGREIREAGRGRPVRPAGGPQRGVGRGNDEADRRARAAAIATMATPILLGAALMQAGLGRLGFDLVTPLVQRFYTRDRLAGAATGTGAELAARPPAVEALLGARPPAVEASLAARPPAVEASLAASRPTPT
jgi:hypothetical protein